MKMGRAKLALIGTVLSLGVGACGPDRVTERIETVNPSESEKAARTPEQKAENLAIAGEKLFYTPSFFYSEEVFKQALEFDPKNVRARFYLAALIPLDQNRGFYNRIMPLLSKLPVSAQNAILAGRDSIKFVDLKQFLMDGPKDIFTENDLQNHIQNVYDAFMAAHDTLMDLRGEHLKIHITSYESKTVTRRECYRNDRGNEWCYDIHYSDEYNQVVRDTNLDFYDFHALAMMIKAQAIYHLTTSLAFDLSGGTELAQELSVRTKLTDEFVINKIRGHQNLGRIKNPKVLKEILNLGSEFVEGVDMISRVQGELCSKGLPHEENRFGFLFSHGFCATKELSTAANIVSQAVKGPVNLREGLIRPFVIDVPTPLNGGLSDAKSILPDKFNSRGCAIGIPDDTMAGALPNGDFVEVVRINGNPNFLMGDCR